MHSEYANTERQSIYQTALTELEKLQDEIICQRVAGDAAQSQRLSHQRHQRLLAGGVLLSSLLAAVSIQAVLPILLGPQPLQRAEAEALHNLIDYVAMRQAADEVLIAHALCARFAVTTVDELESSDYDEAIVYLLRLAG